MSDEGVWQPSARKRKPGDAIPGALIRQLRERKKMTQVQLAAHLGLPSGEGIVAAWESGRATCDGPAAELVLRLLGAGTKDIDAELLISSLNEDWLRTGERSVSFWRQFCCVSETLNRMSDAEWPTLFPTLSIPPEKHVHGFPFIDAGLPPDVYAVQKEFWVGSIPSDRNDYPRYAWMLSRTGQFVYRERPWEEDPLAITHGHVLAGSLLELAMEGTFFMTRVFKRWQTSPKGSALVRIDVHDMKGRGISVSQPGNAMIADTPPRVSSEDHIEARLEVQIARVVDDPLGLGFDLVAALIATLRQDVANRPALETELKTRIENDKRFGESVRFLGYLDGAL